MNNDERNDELQRITRHYLESLKSLASKFGLGKWVQDVIEENKRGECSATIDETQALARLCDDERVARQEVPKLLGKSYRHCVENEIFERLKKLRHVGVYDKISVLLFKKSEK